MSGPQQGSIKILEGFFNGYYTTADVLLKLMG